MEGFNHQFKKVSQRINDELYFNGYTKLGNIGATNLKKVILETENLKEEIKPYCKSGKLFALIDTHLSLFLQSNKIAQDYLADYVKYFFSEEEVDVFGASHLVKPFGNKSKFACHQDSSIVNEPDNFSINAWMPLTDVNRLNGCIWMLPGSHILPNFRRIAGQGPFVLEDIQKDLWKKMIPIPVKAGDVILFHRSILHGSSRNFLPWHRYRFAIEAIVLPKNAQLIVNYVDENTPQNKVHTINIKKEHFFENEDPRGEILKGLDDSILNDYPAKEFLREQLYEYFEKFKQRANSI